MATKLEISELDFDGIKSNLKTFLSQQNEFTDYDFEGSGMSVLLDTLAYNTHYLAYNANMLANEMYLDSADLRSSVVSLAKQVGYTPTSCTSSTATIDVLVMVLLAPLSQCQEELNLQQQLMANHTVLSTTLMSVLIQ